MASFVGSLISQFQLTSNVSVLCADSNQILFQLDLGIVQGVVQSRQLIQLGIHGCNLTFSGLLGSDSLFQNSADFGDVSLQKLDSLHIGTILISSYTQFLFGIFKGS